MDGKKHKLQWQSWKTSPTWDPLILPRPFASACIRSMTCYQSVYIVVLSGDSNIEIWHSKHGTVVYNKAFSSKINRIDFIDMYCHEKRLVDDIKEWTLILANHEGDIISANCSAKERKVASTKVNVEYVKSCFCKLIGDTQTIILIGTNLLILRCCDFTQFSTVYVPGNSYIDCALVLENDAVISCAEKLYFCDDVLSGNQLRNQDCHKSSILELIDIDNTYMASISWEKVVIWKRPRFNLARVFDLNFETVSLSSGTAIAEKYLTCLVHNSRFLIIGLNLGLAIFDCTTGCPITEFQYVSDTPIIKAMHLDWLSMLLIVSKDGRIRFLAYQIADTANEPMKVATSPFSTKSFSFLSFSRQSSMKEVNQLSFLGKSFEKDKEKSQIFCFLELENAIKSKDHFVNLEDIGMLTSDGSSSLVLWRNRDYAFSSLIHSLQV